MTKVYTVSELNTEVQSYLRQRYPAAIWVQGEIKNYNRNAHKDHVFFELCEKEPNGDRIRARITAVIFEGVKPRLEASLGKIEDGFQLQDDIEVKFECTVDLYPPSGSYQLRIVDVDPFYTVGKIAQQRHAILATLKRENLLDRNKTLEVPRVPLRIGLITSYNSAVYHDFLKELSESGYGFQVWHVDAHMQGRAVARDVCRALQILQEQKVDVIVIIRGGGARSDMVWFDNLRVGRAVAISQIPVFTGLGHEIDLSVTDLVAHTYKKTPTAVAQYLVSMVEQFLSRLMDIENEMVRDSQVRLQETLLSLKGISERIGVKSIFRLDNAKLQLEVFQARQNALDPVQVFRRGFSLSMDSSGKTIRRLSSVRVGEVLTTVLIDGQLRSQVSDKIKK